MAETDSPLKLLVSEGILDFAAWLLHADVQDAQPLNVELPGENLTVDLAYRIRLRDARETLLHLEFQGPRSREPMWWRMLTYMPRLARLYRLPLCSVVLYVGRGAGTDDQGSHEVLGPDGMPALTWRYHAIRLWEMPAETLLRLDRPALLALVGQTRLTAPAVVLPEVVRRLRQVPDVMLQRRFLTALTALLTDEEMITMVESLIDRDDVLLDTPFLRRLREESQRAGREEGRQEGREEGRQEGRQEGHEIGLQEGRQEGRRLGTLLTWRRSILDSLVTRLDPPASVYQQVADHLEQLTDEATLAALFKAMVRMENVAQVRALLAETGQRTPS